jgi:hypothetical protein
MAGEVTELDVYYYHHLLTYTQSQLTRFQFCLAVISVDLGLDLLEAAAVTLTVLYSRLVSSRPFLDGLALHREKSFLI